MQDLSKIKGNIIVDCDEVLTLISPYWTQLIYDNKDKFKDFLNLREEGFNYKDPNDIKHCLSREEFYLNKWLTKDIYKEEGLPKNIIDTYMELYTKGDFYDNCYPTSIVSIINDIINYTFIETVYIVTRIINNKESYISKNKFLKRCFNNEKIKFIYIDPKGKKSDFINSLLDSHKNISLIFEDEIKNIEDILINIPSFTKFDTAPSFIIPSYGYNKPTEYMNNLIEEEHIDINYFNF